MNSYRLATGAVFLEGLDAPETGWKTKVYKLEIQMMSVVCRLESLVAGKTSLEGPNGLGPPSRWTSSRNFQTLMGFNSILVVVDCLTK